MTDWQKLWTFKTAHFAVHWAVTPDTDADISWLDSEELDAFRRGELNAFVSKVWVEYEGTEIGADVLCGSFYRDIREFRDHIGARGQYGSYFADMVSAAIHEARAHFANFPKLRSVA
jgi:hypothetical protein